MANPKFLQDNNENMKEDKFFIENKLERMSEVARLTKLAIGSRSCSSFSKESELSISFISRLINCNLPAIPSKKSLQKIALASESRVTYEKLLIAAGYEIDDISLEIYEKEYTINNPTFIISDDVNEICAQINNLIEKNVTKTFKVIVLAKKFNTLAMLKHKIFKTQNNIIIQYALILD